MELQVTKGQQSHIHEKSSQNEKWLYNNNKEILILTSWFRKHIDNPIYTFLAMATTTATTATAPTTIATTPMRRRFYFLTCWKEGLKTILRILKKTVKDGKSFKVGRKFSKKILSLFSSPRDWGLCFGCHSLSWLMVWKKEIANLMLPVVVVTFYLIFSRKTRKERD